MVDDKLQQVNIFFVYDDKKNENYKHKNLNIWHYWNLYVV